MELVDNTLYDDAALKSYYRFEGNSTDTKSAHNGSDTNITYGLDYGKYTQGALFNGSTSKVTISAHTDFNPTSTFSIGAWVKADSTGSGQHYLFSNWNYQTTYQFHGWWLAITSTGLTRFSYAVDHTTLDDITGTTDLRDDEWHFVVITKDGTGVDKGIVYVDGELENSITTTGDVLYDPTMYVRMGIRYNSSADDGFYKGAIDDLFIFNNKALSATEVKNLYTEPQAGGSPMYYF